MKDTFKKLLKGSPYELTQEIGIGPDSSMTNIKNASLKILVEAHDSNVRSALKELRFVTNRLFTDFFLYQIRFYSTISKEIDIFPMCSKILNLEFFEFDLIW